jgi:PAS domain S-box-containing protein
MKETIVIGLIRNIAILLTFSILYDHFWASRTKPKGLVFKIMAGVFLGGVVIILILTPWNYGAGVFFDTRSVMLSISGLFFGPIPTIVAMFISSAYRLSLGGSGTYMGLAVILFSGTIGILWGYFKPDWQKRNSLNELIKLGLTVHVVMLGCTQLLPAEIRLNIFKEVFLSVIVLYPFATVLLGKYILRQNKARDNKEALDASEKRWQFALEGAGDGIWDWNPQTNEIYFSKQWKNMLGYDDAEIKNTLDEWENRVHPADLSHVNQLIKAHLAGDSLLYSSEHRLQCKDGSYKWILDSGKIMQRDEDGNPIRFIGTHKDISDRKEKELSLAYERFLLDSLMNFAPESIYFKDLDSKFIRVNKAAALNLGCDNVEDIIGKSDFDFYDHESASKRFVAEQEIIKTGKLYQTEEYGLTKAGRETWGITNKMPLRNYEGDIIGTFGLSINITERKYAEQALKESERYTNSILKAIPDLIFIFNPDGVYLDFKTGNPQDLVFPQENFIDKNLFEVLPHSVATLIKEKIDLVLRVQSASMLEYQMEMNGDLNDFECFVLPFDADKVIAMVRNITQRKQVESELKNSQEQLKNFAAHLQDIREEERMLLAREIHDELGQILIALKIDLGMFKQLVLKNIKTLAVDNIQTKFNQIFDLVDTTIKTTRKIMTGLRPEVLEIVGFHEAARLYLIEFSDRYKINSNFVSFQADIMIDSQQSIALFRILQEALTNTAKHSKATNVVVEINLIDNYIKMKISDNGIGFDDSKKKRNDSYGLIGMKERVYLLDGKLTISGNPGKGTEILVEMPYNP